MQYNPSPQDKHPGSVSPKEAKDSWHQLAAAQNLPSDSRIRIASAYQEFIDKSPRKKLILAALKEAFDSFSGHLKQCGLSAACLKGDHTAELHAAAASLGAYDFNIMKKLAQLTYFLHVIDDQFDSILDGSISQEDAKNRKSVFLRYRFDIKALAKNWPLYGSLIDALSEVSLNKSAYFRGVQRTLYGSLIARSQPKEQERLLMEYRHLSFTAVSPPLKENLKNIRPIVYYFTNKAAMEILPLQGSAYDSDLNELRSLCFTPVLLLTNLSGELANKELNFCDRMPEEKELCDLVSFTSSVLKNFNFDAELFYNQVTFMREVFDSILTPRLRFSYEELGKQLEEMLD